MNDGLLSQLLERARSRISEDRVVTADEVAAWPEGSLASLLREGVLDEIQPVASVECDACFEGHAELVEFVEEPPGSPRRAYIACPETGRVAVDPKRMRRWQIRATSAEVLSALQVDGGSQAAIESRTALWPTTAAAFVQILDQARRAGSSGLRWYQIRERLGALGHHPHRVRDVRRNVPDWDDVVVSPRKGFYSAKS